jgi:NAD(P)-dependent dehydrogenase (short-subunit alcohol dehydrogenase family)
MDHGVRILAVSPGPVDTGRLETMLKKRATLPEWGGQESAWQVVWCWWWWWWWLWW